MNKRLTGAVVLVALAVIFVPMLFDDDGSDTDLVPLIPERPDELFFDDLLPVPEITEVPSLEPQELLDEERYSLPASEMMEPPTILPAPELEPPVALPAPPAVLPAEPLAAPAPIPAPTPSSAVVGDGWVVQAGSFGQNANAESLRDRLIAGGREAFIEPYDVGEKTLYRVRVGPFADRTVAEAELAAVESEFQLKGAVHSFP
jgi:DedD protein